MPNFRASALDIEGLKRAQSCSADGVEFLWAAEAMASESGAGAESGAESCAESAGCWLVLAECEGVQTFVQVSKKQNYFVCKIDKIAKHSDLALMQRVLAAFAKASSARIIDAACAQNLRQKPASNILQTPEQIAEFAAAKPGAKVFLEIGFGSGRHLLAQAAAQPEALFIGAEIHRPSLLQTSKLAAELANIRLLDADARILLAALPDGLLSGIWLHFPVPWPNAPSRRVISADFEQLCARKLLAGGHFHLRTDEKFYFDAAKVFFAAWRCEEHCNAAALRVSKYEARWQRMGKDVWDLFAYKSAAGAYACAREEASEANALVGGFKSANLRKCFAQREGVFAKISRLYKTPVGTLALAHLGSFDAPSSCYLLATAATTTDNRRAVGGPLQAKNLQIIARRPILSEANRRAFALLEELLCTKR